MKTLERQLGDHFRQEVSELEVTDLLPGVQAKVRRARRRLRIGSAVAAAAVVALVVGGIPIWRSAIGPSTAKSAPVRPFTVLTRTNLVTLGPLNLMAAVPGGVWLSSSTLGEIFRVDAATGRITARIGGGAYSMAYGAGSLWVNDFQATELLRLDPATGHLLARIRVPAGTRGVAVAGGYVWVTVWGGPPWPSSGRYQNRLVKISPVSDRIVAIRWLPGNGGPGGMTVAASRAAIWLFDEGGSGVLAASPASLRPIGYARTGAWRNATALAAGGRQAWVLIDGTLFRIDPPWSAVSRRAELYPANVIAQLNLGPQAIGPGPGGTIWAGGPGLYRINQATLRSERIQGFGAVDNVSAIGQTLWVQTDDNYLLQLALNRPSAFPAVPDVVGLPAAAARQLLVRDGFTVRVIRRHGSQPPGRVFFQDPAVGSLVPARTIVTIFIATRPRRAPRVFWPVTG